MKNGKRFATVSVITPNFNHGSLIANAIRSVAGQSRSVYEHIIVDDASTDDSRVIIRGMAQKYASIKLLENERNVGPVVAGGYGISAAGGDYIQFLSADDVLPQDTLAERMMIADSSAQPVLICGDVGYLDVKTGRIDHRRYLMVDRPVYISPAELVAQQRRGLNVVNGGSALVPREDLLKAKMEDPELRWHCDMLAYNAIAYRRGVWYVPGMQHYFHVGLGNFGHGSLVWSRQKRVLARILELLDTDDFRDVREQFRASAVLASCPHIVKFLILHPARWEYLTMLLVKKALFYWIYRKLRKFLPLALINRFVRKRTRIG